MLGLARIDARDTSSSPAAGSATCACGAACALVAAASAATIPTAHECLSFRATCRAYADDSDADHPVRTTRRRDRPAEVRSDEVDRPCRAVRRRSAPLG